MEIKTIVSSIIQKDNTILMVREAKKECRGQWNIPSGHLDAGENMIAAAIRETKEETGYDTKVTALKKICNYRTKNGSHIIRYFFKAEITGGKVCFDKEEILEVRWIQIDEITTMPDKDLRDAGILRSLIRDLKTPPHPLSIIDDKF